MGADYSFYVKSIATYAPAFFVYNNSVLARVYGKLLELVSICNSLNDSEGKTIFGRNDTNTEGMTIIQKE